MSSYMFSRLVRYLGFGLATVGVQNAIEEESANTFNLATSIVGCFLYSIGTYCEHRCGRTQSSPTSSPSTTIISNLLRHASGYGFIGAITSLARRQDTISANLAKLGRGCLMPIAITELEKTSQNPPPPLKWEKSRFIVLVVSDYLSSFSLKHILNHETWNLFSIISLPIGLALSLGEFIYGYKNDEKIDLKRALDRRLFKLSSVMSLIFTVSDIAKNQMNRNMIVDDTYSIITGALLFAVTVKLWQMEKTPQPAVLTQVAVSKEPLLPKNISIKDEIKKIKDLYSSAKANYYARNFDVASKKAVLVSLEGQQIINQSCDINDTNDTIVTLIKAGTLLGHIAKETSKDSNEAKKLYQQTAAMCVSLYGKEHPTTKVIEKLIAECKPIPLPIKIANNPPPASVDHFDYDGPIFCRIS